MLTRNAKIEQQARDDENLTVERPTFVTHLECSVTGERYPADELHNLSRAGKPLLVRYDLAGVTKSLEQGGAGAAAARSLALSRAAAGAARRRHRQPRRGGHPDRRDAQARQDAGGGGDPGEGRRPAADRLVQGARAGDGGVDGEGARRRPHGDADQRQCGRGACRLCQPRRHQDHGLLPARTRRK